MGTRRTKNQLGKYPGVTVKAKWTIGPRTATWMELWRRILIDVLLDNEQVTNGADQGPPAEFQEFNNDR